MPTEIDPPKPQVSFYGKKTYLLHMLLVEKIIQRKNISANFYEDVDKDRDR